MLINSSSSRLKTIFWGCLFLFTLGIAEGIPKPSLADNTAYLTFIFWVWLFLTGQKIKTPTSCLFVAIMVFFILIVVSFGINQPESYEGNRLTPILTFLAPFIWYLLVSVVDVTEDKVKLIITIFWSSLTGILLWSMIMQYGEGFSIHHRFGRHPNVSAALIALGVTALIFAILHEKDKRKIGLEVVSLLICSIALVFTYSRAAWIAVAGGTVWLVWMSFKSVSRKVYIWGIPILGIIGLMLFLFIPSISDRVQTIFDLNYHSNSERILIWENSLKIIKSLPFFDWGPSKLFGIGDRFGEYSEMVCPRVAESAKIHAHNNVLNVTVKYGFLGLVGLCIVIWTMFSYGIRIKREIVFKTSNYAELLMSWLLIFIIIGIVDYSLNYKSMMYMMMFLFGLLSAMLKKQEIAVRC